MATTTVEEVFDLRRKLYDNGFRPVAVYTAGATNWHGEAIEKAGKRAKGDDWREKALRNPPDAAKEMPFLDALNTGILCDGLRAVDIDVDEPEIVSQIEAFATCYLGAAPRRSRSNSARVLYLYRAATGEPKRVALKREGEGEKGIIEILGRGQQFVSAGTHPSGVDYAWPNGGPADFHRDQLTPVTEDAVYAFLRACAPLLGASLPQRCIDAPQAQSITVDISLVKDCHLNYAAGALKGKLAHMLQLTLPNSSRNELLNKEMFDMGGYVSNGTIEYETVADSFYAVMEENGYVAEHGKNDTLSTIHRSIKEGMEKPHELRGDEVETLPWIEECCKRWVEECKARLARKLPPKGWPIPMNSHAFIGIAGEVVCLEEPVSEADPNAMLVALLTMLGSIIGRGAYFTAERDRHHTNLFALIVGDSSNGRKGVTSGRAYDFVKRVDFSIISRTHNGIASGEALVHVLRDPVSGIDGKGKAFTDQGISDKRILVYQGEFGQTLRILASPTSTLSPMVRDGWDSKPLGISAKHSKDKCMDPHISWLGNITVEELTFRLSAEDQFNGFANRFLYVCSHRSKLLPSPPMGNETRLQELARITAGKIEASFQYGEIVFTPDAAALWARMYEPLETRPGGIVGAMTSRAVPQVRRIAMIYAILDGSRFIDVPHLQAALEVWRYCMESAKYIFGRELRQNILQPSRVEANQEKLLSFLASRSDGAAMADIYKLFHNKKKVTDIRAMLNALRDEGTAWAETRQSDGPRPAETWFAVQ
jgi:hypothetical protein